MPLIAAGVFGLYAITGLIVPAVFAVVISSYWPLCFYIPTGILVWFWWWLPPGPHS